MNKLRRIEVQGIPAHPHAVPVPRKAVFHCFSTTFEELRNGVGQFPAAIVEYENGTVETVFADRIRFLDPPNATHDGRRIRRTVDGIVGGDCATCERNDADVAGDSGACVMGHGLCEPPQQGCLDYVIANAESEVSEWKTS